MRGTAWTAARTAFVVLALSVGVAAAQQKKDHLGGRASDLVRLSTNLAACANDTMHQIGPNGEDMGEFVLPPKTVLVVTDLVATPNLTPAAGVTRGGLINQTVSNYISPYFAVDFTQQAMQAIHLTAGVRWAVPPRGINACDSANAFFLDAYGYLAKDK